MKITAISTKVTHGHFRNTSLFANVEEGDDLQQCYDTLTAKIHSMVEHEEEANSLNQEISYLEKRVSDLREDVKVGSEKKAKIEQWMKKFNIPIDAFIEDEIPF